MKQTTYFEDMRTQIESKSLLSEAQELAFDYIDTIEDRPVFPNASALNELAVFDEPLPERGHDGHEILAQLHQYGSPATTAQIGGRYFGFVNGGVIPTSLAARWLADVWDQNAALHAMSPINAKLEAVAERWVRELLGLPDNVVAGFVSGTSISIFCGLVAARFRVLKNQGWNINRQGLYGAPPVRVVTGNQAHATVMKGIALTGFGLDTVEWVPTDDQGRLTADQLPELDERTIVILQAGNVNSGSFDPFLEVCQKARRANAWVHIDGAFGLWAAASSQLQHLTQGIELANSWSVDGHKTLNTPYDSGISLCADREALSSALQATGSYIAYGDQRDGMRYTPEMSRRARGIDLWAALKYLGRAGVDTLIYGLHERSVQFGQELQAAGFQILNDIVFNQTIVTCDNDDDLTAQTLHHIQQSGECWVGGSTWRGRNVIRISVCSWATTADDVSRSVQAFVNAREKAIQSLN